MQPDAAAGPAARASSAVMASYTYPLAFGSELLLSLSRHSSTSCVLAVLVWVGACRSIEGSFW